VLENAERLTAWRKAPMSVAILTDIDGTLAPIAPSPSEAVIPDEIKKLLAGLDAKYLLVAGVSGRKTEEARELIGLDHMTYFGNHGFEVMRGGEIEVLPEARPYMEKIGELERLARERLAPLGASVEDKKITASVHFRNVPPDVGEKCVEFIRNHGERLGLRVTVGRGVVEARPPIKTDKGTAVRTLIEEYKPKRAMFLGDDTTDLDAFRALESMRDEGILEEILRVGVRSEEGPPEIVSEADIVAEGVEGVTDVLRALLGE
jgi:trehalose 6-phosphate phosphatase